MGLVHVLVTPFLERSAFPGLLVSSFRYTCEDAANAYQHGNLASSNSHKAVSVASFQCPVTPPLLRSPQPALQNVFGTVIPVHGD